MRELTTSVMSYLFAKSLYAGQELAKMVGVSEKHVTAKNAPAPGPNGEDPTTLSGHLYKGTKRTVEKFGDPAAVMFIAGDEYQSKAIDVFFDVLSLKALSPSYWTAATDHAAHTGQADGGRHHRQGGGPLHPAGEEHPLHLHARQKQPGEARHSEGPANSIWPSTWTRPTPSGTSRTSGRSKDSGTSTRSGSGS